MADKEQRRGRGRAVLFVSGGLLRVGLIAWLAFDWWSVLPADLEAGYVGRARCIECHKRQGDLWHGSHHDLAMDRATEQTVLGNFNDAEVEHYGITSRMFRQGDKFMVHTEGPDAKLHDYEVKYVLGVEPLQQYMVEFNRPDNANESEIGQLQVLLFLKLSDCPLKELPPELGQLLALTDLDIGGCKQLTLAPGAEEGQPAQTIVAAYARLLIVEPRKDTPGQLHAFLLANPLAVPAFFKSILTDAAHAAWLGEAVKATPSLAGLTDADGRRAIDVAHSACKQAMQAALFYQKTYL